MKAQTLATSAPGDMVDCRGRQPEGVRRADREVAAIDPVVCARRCAEFRLAGGLGSVECTHHCEQSEAWRKDVALAISVNDEGAIAIIHMAGTLDHGTAVNVTALVSELIADGHKDFELQTAQLCVLDEDGVDVLLGLQRLVFGAGGRLMWSGSVANRSFPVDAFAPQRHRIHEWRPATTTPVKIA